MSMNKKGQAAMEFLMTYGWAILVVLAAIGALAYFGVLSPDKFLADKYVLSGGFSAGSYKIGSNGTVFLEAQNNLGVGVSAANINITSKTTGITCTNTVNLGVMGNGDKAAAEITCATMGSIGSKFRGDVAIVYTKEGESVSHTAGGTITGKVE